MYLNESNLTSSLTSDFGFLDSIYLSNDRVAMIDALGYAGYVTILESNNRDTRFIVLIYGTSDSFGASLHESSSVINENEKQEYPDGSYIKQYVVHAPEWDIYQSNLSGFDGADKKVNHFIISESTRMGYLETFVFACDDQGVVENMIEVAGGRDYTADQGLASFALIMMEAGYDSV